MYEESGKHILGSRVSRLNFQGLKFLWLSLGHCLPLHPKNKKNIFSSPFLNGEQLPTGLWGNGLPNFLPFSLLSVETWCRRKPLTPGAEAERERQTQAGPRQGREVFACNLKAIIYLWGRNKPQLMLIHFFIASASGLLKSHFMAGAVLSRLSPSLHVPHPPLQLGWDRMTSLSQV